ncbi:hypothetical protein Bca52824_070771 [Brassica carinata]|uniref:Uncharacterized protein n=1 Tax=Brassica carinata TaxID=52824 RepID=A0A8X7Q5J6_BRACI|nr:hypothetical protein Bca52824_070771 [Brassica carinata]
MVDSAYVVGRNEILGWINDRLHLNHSPIEDENEGTSLERQVATSHLSQRLSSAHIRASAAEGRNQWRRTAKRGGGRGGENRGREIGLGFGCGFWGLLRGIRGDEEGFAGTNIGMVDSAYVVGKARFSVQEKHQRVGSFTEMHDKCVDVQVNQWADIKKLMAKMSEMT